MKAPARGLKLKTLLLSLLIASELLAQERKVDATWLHRYVPGLSEAGGDLASGSFHYKPVFGDGDPENRLPRSVPRFAEVTLDAHGNCQTVRYDREEEIYFVLEGKAFCITGIKRMRCGQTISRTCLRA